jgi:transcriptional repressor NrdR
LTPPHLVLKARRTPQNHKMYCSRCGSIEDRVIDSRLSKDGRSIRRRRECIDCSQRFTTYEEIERADLRVMKRDGRSEPFDRHKLLTGISKACEKRPVSREALEKAVEEIIQELEQGFQKEIPSHVIGARVMDKLHQLDEVAYVRYASVYRSFQDIGEFINEIQSLGRKHKRSALQPELFK